MNAYEPHRKDEKKGFLPFFSKVFQSSSKTVGGLGSAASKAAIGGAKGGFFASLFATKAGIVGLMLGAATIAAGIGVIYNYISPSSGKIYTPNLFSNAYYEEAQRQANAERANYAANPSQGVSSLDVFREGAQKEFADQEKTDQTKESSENASATAPEVNAGDVSASGEVGHAGWKLQANLGFDSKSAGGSGTSGAKLQTSGGLWGGIGKQFSPISRNVNTANSGASSKMNKGLTARVIASPKYTVPNINKKGAFGQAKYAANVGKQSAYNVSDAGARTTAEQAFSGETAGSGDIATPIGGSGIGGAGLSQGNKLKANDPALSMNEYTPPTPNKSDDTPWKKLTDYALYGMLASAAFIFIASLLANKAKALLASPVTAPGAISLFNAAKVFCYLAMAAAAVVIGIGVMLATKYGQKWMGIMYGLVGGTLIFQAYKALSGINEGLDKAQQAGQFYDNAFSKMSESQQAAFKALPADQQWQQVSAYNANPNDYMSTLNLQSATPSTPSNNMIGDFPDPGDSPTKFA
ncbi:MAG: hypothetical protein K6357_06920 [Elusimicrobiota bacterium]